MTSINKELQIWQKLFNHIKSALHKSAWDLIEKKPLHSQHKQVRGERIPLQIPRSGLKHGDFFPVDTIDKEDLVTQFITSVMCP